MDEYEEMYNRLKLNPYRYAAQLTGQAMEMWRMKQHTPPKLPVEGGIWQRFAAYVCERQTKLPLDAPVDIIYDEDIAAKLHDHMPSHQFWKDRLTVCKRLPVGESHGRSKTGRAPDELKNVVGCVWSSTFQGFHLLLYQAGPSKLKTFYLSSPAHQEQIIYENLLQWVRFVYINFLTTAYTQGYYTFSRGVKKVQRLNLEAALSSTAQVKALVPNRIFKRAKELVSSNKLHSICFQGPLLNNSIATCTGSNPGDNYNLSILIDAESPSKPRCQCSCPAQAKGNLCKHVVALLLLRTKELAKGAKAQSNASVLSEFKLLAEDRLAGDKGKKPTLSDSQAAEEFVPSDDKPRLAYEEMNATAQLGSPVIKNNQKPSWILGDADDDKHLQMEKSNNESGQYQPGENAVNDARQNNAAAPKKKGSIFAVQGWNEIVAKSLDAKDASFSQETSDMPVLPSTFVGELQKSNSEASAELGPVCGGIAKGANSLEPAENIVE